uniref:Retrovirus-related Pol polyprotein from transposon TNT 1-94 n=1 Tax=Cajanus cajan TaxID=3821 RepID=A0A151SPQ3_CAJCA|nr:Retrovirus-related Pol polyprotein from transposon TNT 1-94 [Cajanus cajan]
MDTGASYHMTFNRKLFNSFKEWNDSVKLGDDEELGVKGSSAVHIKMYDGMVRTFDAWYVPGLQKNLISIGTLDKQGYSFSGNDGQITFSKGSLVVMKGKLQHGIYVMLGNSFQGTVFISHSLEQHVDNTELWHHRLGHMSERGLVVLSKQGLLGGAMTGKLKFCESCKFSHSKHTSIEILQYVHSDLWDPSTVQSHGRSRYFVTFIDDYFRKVWVYFLKSKDEVFGRFKEWKTMVEKRTGKLVKTLITNNELEFCNALFDDYCKELGIVRHLTVRHTPQQMALLNRDSLVKEGNQKTYEVYVDVTNVVDINSIAYALVFGENLDSDEPKFYKEAIQSKETSKWLIAMDEKMQSLKKNQTLELVPLPRGVKLVGCKWVLKRIEGIPGVKPSKFKARLVAKGFSQIEAEYMSLTERLKKGIWLQGLIDSFGLNVHRHILYCDSQSALCLAKNSVYHERSKHIDVRLNFIRDVIEDKLFSIEKIATVDNPVDMLTKPLSFEKFKHSLDLVNVRIA